MKEFILMVFTALGGLGVFLLGMKHLSEGLQAIAGGGLRKFMAYATGHRIYGVGSGIVSTMIVQSSSIITVMLVSFVSTALMTLPQAFSVLIGANIGTTSTVWILACAPDPQMLGFAGIAAGGILFFFFRGEKIRYIGLTLLGLGLVFLGFYLMTKGVAPLRNNEAVAGLFKSLGIDSLADVAMIAFVAIILSAAVHSAATIMIALALAMQGLISYEVAVAALFGANVGTTATGWLAAVGGTADARRAAFAHTVSNLVGTIVLMPFFFVFFAKVGPWIFPDFNTPTFAVVSGVRVETYANMMAPIALTDSVFAILRAMLFFPVIRPFCALIEKVIKQPENEKPHLSKLRTASFVSPVIACDQALEEVYFMKESNIELLDCVRRVITGEADERVESHIGHREEILDNVQKEITEFLGGISSKRLAKDVAGRVQRILRFTDELESVSDEMVAIVKAVRRLRTANQSISKVSVQLLLTIHAKISDFAGRVTSWIRSPRPIVNVAEVQAESSAIHEFLRSCRATQLGRVGPEDPGSSMRVLAELDIINAYERVRSYYLNIAEVIAGGKR